MINYNNGINLKGTSLWLDSKDPQDLCFVSHAHVDHLARHSRVICSKPTADLLQLRMPIDDLFKCDFFKEYSIGDLEFKLYPSGHILGAAQIKVFFGNNSYLYSGDFKLKSNYASDRITIPTADILIMESTYGNESYIFPDQEIVIAELIQNISRCFDSGHIPVLAAYALGKSQEIAKILGDKGLQVVAHRTVYEILKVYESFGVDFQNVEILGKSDIQDRKVLIIPPYLVNSKTVANIKNKKIFSLSPWSGISSNFVDGVDYTCPFSDHADFNELLDYVRAVNPKKVFLVHGDVSFVDSLSKIGYDSEFIGEKPSLNV